MSRADGHASWTNGSGKTNAATMTMNSAVIIINVKSTTTAARPKEGVTEPDFLIAVESESSCLLRRTSCSGVALEPNRRLGRPQARSEGLIADEVVP